MRRIWGILFSVLLIVSCSDEIPEKKVLERSGRTVLAYLVANNAQGDLGSYLKENVEDMYAALASSKDSCTLLVYYRPAVSDREVPNPVLMEFLSDGEGRINGQQALLGREADFAHIIEQAHRVKEYREPTHSAVNPQTMKRIFRDMQEVAPSDSYGLILGSHASGWLPGMPVEPRAFGDDAGYNIDIPQLADVISGVFPSKLDFILFDACMMGTAEVCYELKDVTRYCVASVMETPAFGYPYDDMLLTLYRDQIDFNAVCNAFISFNKYKKQWGTCAAFNCSMMDELALAVKTELAQSTVQWADFDYTSVQQYGLGSFQYFSFDVADFFRELHGGVESPLIEAALQQVVVAKDCIPDGYYPVDEARFSGIGMYYPKMQKSWNTYYKTSISWYQAVGWEQVIN